MAEIKINPNIMADIYSPGSHKASLSRRALSSYYHSYGFKTIMTFASGLYTCLNAGNDVPVTGIQTTNNHWHVINLQYEDNARYYSTQFWILFYPQTSSIVFYRTATRLKDATSLEVDSGWKKISATT